MERTIIESLPMPTALTVLAAYCLGSISFAIVLSRLMRLPDPRSYGSKNPGTTNVLRSGRTAAAVLTLLGDAGKGWLAVWLAAQITGDAPAVALGGLAVFLGHLYPVFHRFQGGKGVATAAGALFGFDLWLGCGSVATWIIIAAFFRYSSLAAVVAALFACVFAFVILGVGDTAATVLVMSAFLVWRHKANMLRLLAGTEPRLGAKKL